MSLTSIIQQATPDDTILSIGPGSLCETIKRHDIRAQLIIVEPDLIRATDLQRNFYGYDRVTILQQGLAFNSKDAIYHEYNFPAVNSMRAQSGLEHIFPGLELRATHETRPIEIPELLATLPSDHRSMDVLIIDALGDAMDILTEIETADVLSRFNYVIVRATRRAYHDGAAPLADITRWLKQKWYDKPFPLYLDDPDFPVVCFRKSAIAEQLQIATRMKLVAQNDLENLQLEYRLLHEQKETRDQLFLKITEQLSEVSKFLHEPQAEANKEEQGNKGD